MTFIKSFEKVWIESQNNFDREETGNHFCGLNKFEFGFRVFSEYFFNVKRKAYQIIKKITASVICAGFVFSVLFGQGTHLHSIFDHLFDHGDIHVYVHSHSHSADHEHEGSGYDFEDSHNHPISKLNLKSVRTSTPQQNGFQLSESFVGVASGGSEFTTDELNPTYLDLPPPDRTSSLNQCYSFSLRAPPVG